MSLLIVDASVVVKWYIPEQDHEQARELRNDYLNGTHTLSAPAHLPFEVINALRYSGHYEGDRLDEAAATLPEYGIRFEAYGDINHIASIATALDNTIYDAAYIALAVAHDTIVYTADSALIEDTIDTEYEGIATHICDYQS